MDFGDILAQWDKKEADKKKNKSTNIPRKRLPNAPGLSAEEEKKEKKAETVKTESLPKANPMDVWLRRYGVVDKDKEIEKFRQQEKVSDREYLKKLPVEATIDLHGLTREEAWNRLNGFVSECSKRGLKKILIVHGKGNHSSEQGTVSVLSAMVRSFIECDTRLGSSGHPDKKLGGSGATWVLIKNNVKGL